MKKIYFMILILVVFLVGCSQDEVKVVSFIKDYKHTQYKIEDYEEPPTVNEVIERIRPFLSEDALKELQQNNNIARMIGLSGELNKNIRVKNTELNKVNETDDSLIKYAYILTLEYYDDQKSENRTVKGELTVKQMDGEYQIIKDVVTLN